MDSTTTIAIIIAVVVLALAMLALLGARRRKSEQLRSRFGPEYDRTMEDAGSRRRAEAELKERQKRVAQLEIRPLPPSQRDKFIAAWTAVQAEFIDQPQKALTQADELLTEVMRARGYPMETFEQRSADLSVDHPTVVQNYRAGREIAVRSDRNTENLRQAMLHFRALFDELVGEPAERKQQQAS